MKGCRNDVGRGHKCVYTLHFGVQAQCVAMATRGEGLGGVINHHGGVEVGEVERERKKER